MGSPRILQAGLYSLSCYREFGTSHDAAGIYAVQDLSKVKKSVPGESGRVPAFFCNWNYYSKLYCCMGKVDVHDVGAVFEMDLPLDPKQLHKFLEDLPYSLLPEPPGPPQPGEKRKRGKVPLLSLWWYPVVWAFQESSSQAKVDLDGKVPYLIKPAAKNQPQPKKKQKLSSSAALTIPVQDVDHDDDDDDDDGLGQELADLLDDGTFYQDDDPKHGESLEDEEADWLQGIGAELDLDLDGNVVDEAEEDESDESEEEDAPASVLGPALAKLPISLQDSVVEAGQRCRTDLLKAFETASRNPGAIYPKGISLIVYKCPPGAAASCASGDTTADPDQIMFVRWEDVSMLSARQITLDSENRIKAIVCCQVPKIQCHLSKIIIKDTGVAMAKEKGMLRTVMPDWCVKIHSHHTAKTFAGPTDPRLEQSAACLVCTVLKKRVRKRFGKNSGLLSRWSLFRCVGCLSYWHKHCVELYQADTAEIEAPFLCPVCVFSDTTLEGV